MNDRPPPDCSTSSVAARKRLCPPLEHEWRQVLDDLAKERRWPDSTRPKELAQQIAKLSHHYNEGALAAAKKNTKSAQSPSRTTSHDKHAADSQAPLSARLLFSFVRDVPKSGGAVAELILTKKLALTDRPLRILDLGAGLGATTWGVIRALQSAGYRGQIEAHLADSDSEALGLAAKIAKKAPKGDISVKITTGALDLSFHDRLDSSSKKYDLILLGQVLVELDPEKSPEERAQSHVDLIRRLIKMIHEHGALVIVEPALRATSRHLHVVHDQLVDLGVTPFAPCLHKKHCPALTRESDWCHEDIAVDLPDWLIEPARMAGLRFEGLTFSYLVYCADGSQLTPSLPNTFRAVSSLIKTKGKTELFLCGPAPKRATSLGGVIPQAPLLPSELSGEQSGGFRAMRLDREESKSNRLWGSVERGELLSISPEVTASSPKIRAEHTIALVGPDVLPANVNIPKRGLYAIIDTVTLKKRGVDPFEFASKVISAKPAVVQLRAKDLSSKAYLELLRAIAPVAKQHGVLFFANDRADLAVLAGCDGIHVGQDDLPLAVVRKIAPGLLVGVSTHNRSQFYSALHQHPDYIAVGPIFDTTSKENPDPTVGVDLLAFLSTQTTKTVVGIGGIDLQRAPQIAAANAMGAVIGALWPESMPIDGVTEQIRQLNSALGVAQSKASTQNSI